MESYVGLLPLLVDIAFIQIHTHMTIYTVGFLSGIFSPDRDDF